jgi:hypothetical protein
MLSKLIAGAVTVVGLSACTSVAQVGILTGPSGDPGSIISEARSYSEIGPVEGKACRYFLLGIIPWGDSTPSAAMDDAIGFSGGDAIINASVETSLYGFVPIYNAFAYTCTTVRGIAIKFDDDVKSEEVSVPISRSGIDHQGSRFALTTG